MFFMQVCEARWLFSCYAISSDSYANDVFAYIPSLRVLREGGYEAVDAMIYYGLHGPWEPSVEETIIRAVHDLTEKAR